MSRLSHLDDQGRARMVDVSDKPSTARQATARGLVRMDASVRDLALAGGAAQGDVVTTAEQGGDIVRQMHAGCQQQRLGDGNIA